MSGTQDPGGIAQEESIEPEVANAEAVDEPGAPKPEPTIEFDPRGDVILSIHSDSDVLFKNVRCCSRILEFTSRVFAAMLGPHFKEGASLRNASCPPTVVLKEEFPMEMVQLLYVLHYRDDFSAFSDNLHNMAAVAVQADKYTALMLCRLGPS